MRLAWATDLHLNFVPLARVRRFCDEVAATGADRLVVSGDIAEAHDLGRYLRVLAHRIGRPIDFVLGNHDFYRGRIADVRAAMAEASRTVPHLNWLPTAGAIPIGSGVALLGHDGWADARFGDFARSTVRLNDYRLIADLAGLDRPELARTLGALGDEAAAFVRRSLPEALADHHTAIFATHVPPFREACVFRGRMSNDEWAPHFSCAAVGRALADVMRAHPDRRLLVLCGHVHSAGFARILPNLVVLTGEAEYRRPEVRRVFEVPDDLDPLFDASPDLPPPLPPAPEEMHDDPDRRDRADPERPDSEVEG